MWARWSRRECAGATLMRFEYKGGEITEVETPIRRALSAGTKGYRVTLRHGVCTAISRKEPAGRRAPGKCERARKVCAPVVAERKLIEVN